MASQFPDMTSTSIFFEVVLFLLSGLVTGLSFMSISALVLELWQFSFIRDWPETWKSEIPSSEFFPIFEDWGEVWIQNFARMSVIKCYWMLQIYRFTVRFLRKAPIPPSPPRLGSNFEIPTFLEILIELCFPHL